MQSPSNPSQLPNSLLTGKLTGNFAESGLARRFSRADSQLIQWFAAKFPMQRNRKFFEHNREFSAKNRECWISNLEQLRRLAASWAFAGRGRLLQHVGRLWPSCAPPWPRAPPLFWRPAQLPFWPRAPLPVWPRSASFFALFTSAGFLFVARALFALGRDAESPDTTSASGALGRRRVGRAGLRRS